MADYSDCKIARLLLRLPRLPTISRHYRHHHSPPPPPLFDLWGLLFDNHTNRFPLLRLEGEDIAFTAAATAFDSITGQMVKQLKDCDRYDHFIDKNGKREYDREQTHKITASKSRGFRTWNSQIYLFSEVLCAICQTCSSSSTLGQIATHILLSTTKHNMSNKKNREKGNKWAVNAQLAERQFQSKNCETTTV